VRWSALSAAGLCLFIAAVDLPAESVARGAELFAEFCQGCHGENRSGLGQYAGELDSLRLILEGETNEMPDFFGIFSDEEVEALYAYLASPLQ
jgi:mono/diheme cytochrome c family protein